MNQEPLPFDEGSSAVEVLEAESNIHPLVKVVTDATTPEALAEVAAREAAPLLSKPFLAVVKSQADYELNAAHIVSLKGMEKALEAKRLSITTPLNATLSAVNDLFRGPKADIKNAIASCESPMLVHVREQDRIRQESEAAARRVAAEETRKQDEARRLASEELQRAQDAALAAAKAVQAETNPFLRAARQAETVQAAETVRVAAETTVAAVRDQRAMESSVQAVAIPQVRAAGTKINRPWKFEYIDKALIPREYMLPNEQLIGATIRTLKGDAKIAGIRIYQDIAIGGR